jgi:phage/conjugal plasmid C-4 type zinc finger TraR family protein
MADEADRAQAREQEILDDALGAVRRKMQRGKGTAECRECGDRIPAARRKAIPGVELCVGCQELLEKRTKRDH